jgi:hypothetical protein
MSKTTIKPNYTLVGTLSALGGVVLGVGGTVLFNHLKRTYFIKRPQYSDKSTEMVETPTTPDNMQSKEEGVFIQDLDGHQAFLTNTEFQTYFELHVGDNNSGVDLDACFLDYALKLNPLNIQFFSKSQKTPVYERKAVDGDVAAVQYCLHELYHDCVNDLTYEKYDIENYAYDKYGNEIFKYIDDSYMTERNMMREFKAVINRDLKLTYATTKKSEDANINVDKVESVGMPTSDERVHEKDTELVDESVAESVAESVESTVVVPIPVRVFDFQVDVVTSDTEEDLKQF